MIVVGKTIIIQVQSTDTVEALKSKIEDIEKIQLVSQRLVFNGKTLENSRILSDYDIRSDSTLHVYLSLPGGCPGAYHC